MIDFKHRIIIDHDEWKSLWISLSRGANSIRIGVIESSYSAVDAVTLDEVSSIGTCMWEELDDFGAFVTQLLRRAEEFLDELMRINPNFHFTVSFKTIQRWIEAIKSVR